MASKLCEAFECVPPWKLLVLSPAGRFGTCGMVPQQHEIIAAAVTEAMRVVSPRRHEQDAAAAAASCAASHALALFMRSSEPLSPISLTTFDSETHSDNDRPVKSSSRATSVQSSGYASSPIVYDLCAGDSALDGIPHADLSSPAQLYAPTLCKTSVEFDESIKLLVMSAVREALQSHSLSTTCVPMTSTMGTDSPWCSSPQDVILAQPRWDQDLADCKPTIGTWETYSNDTEDKFDGAISFVGTSNSDEDEEELLPQLGSQVQGIVVSIRSFEHANPSPDDNVDVVMDVGREVNATLNISSGDARQLLVGDCIQGMVVEDCDPDAMRIVLSLPYALDAGQCRDQ